MTKPTSLDQPGLTLVVDALTEAYPLEPLDEGLTQVHMTAITRLAAEVASDEVEVSEAPAELNQ